MAAKKILVPFDFTKNEIQNAVVQLLGAAPGSPVEGQIYYNSTGKLFYYHNGTTFVSDTDRSRHTGTQAWGTITGTPTTLAGYGISDAAPSSHVGAGGTAHANVIAAGAAGFMTGADKTKLDGIAAGATVNSSDATLLARANHTGTQVASTISDLATVVQGYRLDQFASPTAAVSMGSQKITSLANGTNPTDAINLQQLQDSIAGLSWKDEVRVATTAAGTLATSFANGSSVDSVTLVTGDRILIKDQAAAAENGIYIVQASGAPVRATDADTALEMAGATMFVTNGTINAGQRFVLSTSGTIVLGTTALSFAIFGGGTSYVAGAGLVLATNTFNVGAGTGITVNVDDVAVDIAVVARKFTQLIGDGSATSIAVTHNLSNQWCTVQVIEVGTLKMVEVDITLTSANVATIVFAMAPASNAYRVIITG